ncbi:PEP/pyruvate-binding domain-containing protein [Flavobacterium sp. SUN052]|uniref:PEP/pyruvate-binding domain-containing protein n=1 Tax=Flavobacterium sp. SUN052 TaxID=3002441 RepID=UPI00237DEA1B|nr:PEP/pyruvate-binding domain-containing protein [Flavobacterium sp. SUN052]MEC4005343.1 PEP/pyruvate-binding domain-containing protein [Flavobacterium sp. SUN052]
MKNSLIIAFTFFQIAFATAQNYTNTLLNYQQYNAFKGKPLSDKFSNIESVKVIYDLKEHKLYFFNSLKIRLHYDFVTQYLNYNRELEIFNLQNYSNTEKDRDFLLGNLNHIKGSDKWIFELAASDHMPVELIEQFYEIVSKATFIGKNLNFYLNNREKIALYENHKFKIPCVTSEYIFNDLKYQEVVEGKTVGILKSYKIKELDSIIPKSNEIIILDGTPDNLPNVKGIIVNELQTPLSHLVILGKNRKIPIMAYTKALEDIKLQQLIGKKVTFRIEVDTFYIAETTQKITTKVITKKKKLVLDVTVKELVDLSKIPKKGVNYIGNKAQNMAYLIAISKDKSFKVPENAYAIPFYFYVNHTQKKSISVLINELFNYPHKDSINWINKQLKKIRDAIKKEPINQDLIAKLNSKLGIQTEFKNFRFRSSTNAEDIDGFNGAGLYESKTGILGDATKTFEKAIKQVWASVWNESSYWERELFGIDQKNIAMGVLVHRAFPDELANGVIISKNLARDNFPGITVNVQKGENSVVKPEKGVVCEQFSAYDFNLFEPNSNTDIDYVSQSNLNDNKPLLSIAEINKIYRVTKNIQSRMNRYWNKLQYKNVDLEFKIVGENRELYIKQVRIFND